MGWKMVRDRHRDYASRWELSGKWRISPDPAGSLLRKLAEELGEYAADRDPAELYDMAEVLRELIAVTDPDGLLAHPAAAKTARLGGFAAHLEWSAFPGDARSPEGEEL